MTSLQGASVSANSVTATATATGGPVRHRLPALGLAVALDTTVADVPSEFNDSFAAANAIDGDLATEWSGQDDGDEAFLTLDLGSTTDITGVAFLTRSIADSKPPPSRRRSP